MIGLDLTEVLLYLIVAVLATYVTMLYRVKVCGRQWLASAPTWFMIMQLLFLIGTLLAIDWEQRADRVWVFSITAGLFSFTLGALAANRHYRFRPAHEIRAFIERPVTHDLQRAIYSVFVVGLGLLCVAVGITFAQAVGYNVFALAIESALRGQTFDPTTYSTLRTSISTERYVAVGYAVQFTAILLPVCIYLIYMRARKGRRGTDWLLFFGFLLADLYFLTITGGRGWLLHFLVLFVLLTSSRFGPLPQIGKVSRVSKSLALLALMGFYGLATTFMGRSARTSEGLVGSAGAAVRDFYDRVVGFQAEGHLLIMRHLMERGTVWGGEWWEGLVSVLPRSGKASGIGSELHGFLFNGNTSGSVGLTLWGSLLYNWGFVGLLVVAFCVGALMQSFTIGYVRGGRSVVRVVVLFAAGYRLSSVRDPYSVLLDGFVSIMLLYALMERVGRAKWIGDKMKVRKSGPTPPSLPDRQPVPAGSRTR